MYSIFIFLAVAGLIVGLGAVTVIDIHGFLGRKSSYWTEATVRTHKITKPLIWIGLILFTLGISQVYPGILLFWQLLLIFLMVLNGVFLSFVVSPFLLKQEKEGFAGRLLPKKLQLKISLSFLFSFLSWWGSVGLFVFVLTS